MKWMVAGSRMAVLAGSVLWAGCSTTPRAPESEAHRILLSMCQTLAAAPSFSLESSTANDEVLDGGQAVRISRHSKTVVVRPDRIFASVEGDDGQRALWYKGKALTILDRDSGEYATIKVPGKIEKMLDYVMDEYGLSLMLADLLFSDPYSVLTEKVKTGVYLGRDRVGDCETDHLLFIQDNVDWEIWIDAGDVPLARKVVITRKLEPGSPQFVAVLSNWDLSAAPAADTFEFRAPEGAKQVSMLELIGND